MTSSPALRGRGRARCRRCPALERAPPGPAGREAARPDPAGAPGLRHRALGPTGRPGHRLPPRAPMAASPRGSRAPGWFPHTGGVWRGGGASSPPADPPGPDGDPPPRDRQRGAAGSGGRPGAALPQQTPGLGRGSGSERVVQGGGQRFPPPAANDISRNCFPSSPAAPQHRQGGQGRGRSGGGQGHALGGAIKTAREGVAEPRWGRRGKGACRKDGA